MKEPTVTPAIQDQLPEQPCWGCGPSHPRGLHIKSYWSDDGTVCSWRPGPDHVGWPGVLNGGILAALVDCHCVCTAVVDAYHREQRALDSHPSVAFATGSLSITYLKPVPIDASVELTARISERTARTARLECDVTARGELCARAEVVAIRLVGELRGGE
jgi:acyl-coenzyme A thioesterase PaaI-like protein